MYSFSQIEKLDYHDREALVRSKHSLRVITTLLFAFCAAMFLLFLYGQGTAWLEPALAYAAIAVAVIGFLVAPMIQNEIDRHDNRAIFQLEYSKGEFSYYITTDKTIERNTATGKERVIREQNSVDVDTEVHFRITNLVPNSVKEAFLQARDYLIVGVGNKTLCFQIVGSLDTTRSYSFLNNCYEFSLKPVHLKRILPQLTARLGKNGSNPTVTREQVFRLTYTNLDEETSREQVFYFSGSKYDLNYILGHKAKASIDPSKESLHIVDIITNEFIK